MQGLSFQLADMVVECLYNCTRKGMAQVTASESAWPKPSPEIGGILLMWARGALFAKGSSVVGCVLRLLFFDEQVGV